MQDRKTYAKGSTLESTTGYVVNVGMPIVDDTVTVDDDGFATFTRKAKIESENGLYLITLEINGEALKYRESVTADGMTISIDTYIIILTGKGTTMTGASEGDIVRLLIEPLEVSVSDGFRAAINKAVPQIGGGSGGGFRAVFTYADGAYACDKTYEECVAAYEARTLDAVVATAESGLAYLKNALNKPERYLGLTFEGIELHYLPDGTIE